MYNYYDAVKSDVLEYIKNEIDFAEFDSLDELEDYLNDTLFVEDSVTGNASGSYTFNRRAAKEYVLDNMDLLDKMAQEFSVNAVMICEKFINEDWEYFDVCIRCYVLVACIAEALEEVEEEFNSAHESEE